MLNFDAKLRRLLEWLNVCHDKSCTSPSSFIVSKIDVKDDKYSGRGIYTNQPLEKSELLINIPPIYLLNFKTVLYHLSKYNQIQLDYSYNVKFEFVADEFTNKFYKNLTKGQVINLSSFQLLSFYLTVERRRGEKSWWKPFLDMLPTMTEFDLMPVSWDKDMVDLLPKSTQLHNEKIRNRFDKDYKVISALGDLNREEVLLSWLCINSRCLYMELSTSHDASDNFTMVPYVDFINHSDDDHCKLKIDLKGFKILTSDGYAKDHQIYLNYGPHNNDFLLCEYGFMIDDNKWNDLDISEYIFRYLKPVHIEYLKQIDYYNFYTLTMSDLSFRTQVVLAVIQESKPKESTKLSSLINGFTDGEFYKPFSNRLLEKILKEVCFEYETNQHLQFDSDSRKKVIGSLYRNRFEIANTYIHDNLI